MSNETLLSRRRLFMKLGMLVNGAVAAALAVPIVRFLLSSVTLSRENAYVSWVPLGKVGDFAHLDSGDKMLVTHTMVAYGDVEMRGLPIIFGDAHAFTPLGLAKRPALLLGMNAISGFDKVSIDFQRKRIRLLLPARDSMENQRLAFR